MNPESKRTILLASIGTSPGVLTNAVWALAQQEKAKASLKESLAALSAAQKALMNSSFVKGEGGCSSVLEGGYEMKTKSSGRGLLKRVRIFGRRYA